MNNHTPGPWEEKGKATGEPAIVSINRQDGKVKSYKLLAWIPTLATNAPSDYEEIKANAKLIAAAPTMYEALLSIANYEPSENEYKQAYINAQNICKAAIKKATS